MILRRGLVTGVLRGLGGNVWEVKVYKRWSQKQACGGMWRERRQVLAASVHSELEVQGLRGGLMKNVRGNEPLLTFSFFYNLTPKLPIHIFVRQTDIDTHLPPNKCNRGNEPLEPPRP
jgi:hypothetical protein